MMQKKKKIIMHLFFLLSFYINPYVLVICDQQTCDRRQQYMVNV